MSTKFEITKDNTRQVMNRVATAIERTFETIGGMAEDYAQDALTRQKAVDTGALRNSVTHGVHSDGSMVYVEVGTNMEYAPYIECGTGSGYNGELGGSGRRTPWIWYSDDGVGHKTYGMEARPFIKPAIADHIDEYKRVISTEMRDV